MESMSVPQGEFTLALAGAPPRRPRRAWDAADEYVLHHLAESAPAPAGRVVIVNAGAGALAVALSSMSPEVVGDSQVDRLATVANLERNRIPAAAVRLRDSFDVGEEAPMAGDAGDDDNVTGSLTYRNGSTGQVVTINYLLEESYLGANDCAVLGTAQVV